VITENKGEEKHIKQVAPIHFDISLFENKDAILVM